LKLWFWIYTPPKKKSKKSLKFCFELRCILKLSSPPKKKEKSKKEKKKKRNCELHGLAIIHKRME
jgi:hypothetical protein